MEVSMLLGTIRCWLDAFDIPNQAIAHLLTLVIPVQCPFERNIKLGRWILIHIPPMCKLNPLYDQLITLRFKAQIYLAEQGQKV
jgi:hypothetical protein